MIPLFQHVASSSLTRDWTWAPCYWESWILATGSPGKSWDYFKISSSSKWQVFLGGRGKYFTHQSPSSIDRFLMLWPCFLPWSSGQHSCLGAAYFCLGREGKGKKWPPSRKTIAARAGKDLRDDHSISAPYLHLERPSTHMVKCPGDSPRSQNWQMALIDISMNVFF